MWTFTDPNGKAEVIRVSGRLSANSGDPLLALALKGAGILLGPDYLVANDLNAGRLVRLLPDYKTQETPVYAVYPHSHNLPAKTRTFIDFLAARFSHSPQIKQNGHDGTRPILTPPDLRTVTDPLRHPSASSN
jgi:DNA-binding transcriptional LysR family regulator